MTRTTERTAATRLPARWLLHGCLGLGLIVAAGWGAHVFSLQRALQRLHEAAEQRLEVEAARLDGQLTRFEYLPSLLETSPEVLRLLAAPSRAPHA